MASSRSPAERTGAAPAGGTEVVAEAEVVAAERPIGMIPHVSVEVTKEKRDLILDLAENIFPGKRGVWNLRKGERERWVVLACNILYGNPDVSTEITALAEVLGPGVQAEIDDILLKRNFFLEKEAKQAEIEEEAREERRAREKETHDENLLDQAQKRRIKKERWEMKKKQENKRLAMEVTRHKNVSAKERIGMGLAVIGFAVALVLLVIGLQNSQGIVAGGSGATAVTIVGLVLYHLLTGNKGPAPTTPAEVSPSRDAS
jgi:hypothetical protein